LRISQWENPPVIQYHEEDFTVFWGSVNLLLKKEDGISVGARLFNGQEDKGQLSDAHRYGSAHEF
jgi:hypothetical protein